MASIVALGAVLGLSGCGGEGGGAIDHAGSGAQGFWKAGERWSLLEEARIGEGDEEGSHTFGSVADVELDAMGRAWIADGLNQQIQVFDGSGRHVRTIGRKGAGPAEFGQIAGMTWAPDGTLWVMDGGNSRYAVYDTTGALVDTRRRDSNLTMTPWRGRFDAKGRLYDVAGGLRPDGSIETYLVRFDSALQPGDTFAMPRFHDEVFEIRRGDARNNSVSQVNVPFSGNQVWDLDPNGRVWVANTARYRIERHAFSGGVEKVVERKVEPVPIPRAERDRMLENYEGFVRQGGKIDLSRIPKTYPAHNGFLFDDSGRLWVKPNTDPRHGAMLDVFDPDGRYLGRVALPTGERSAPLVIRGDRMAVMVTDSVGVQSVSLLRIVRPAS